MNSKKCKQYSCWQNACGNGNYCVLHNKLHNQEVDHFYRTLYQYCDPSKWQEFTEKVKQGASEEDDHRLIELKAFEDIIRNFLKIEIADKEKDLLFNTSGRVIQGRKYINIRAIY